MSREENLRVRDVLTHELYTVDGLDTVDQAIDKMRKYQVSSLVVECRDEDDELGVLMVADIARGEWCLEIARQTE